jgi:hypothetical protein
MRSYSLIVDDFGIKYEGIKNAKQLINALKTIICTIMTNWEGTLYCGLTLKWDYLTRTVNLSMPGCIATVLAKFQHPIPEHPQHSHYGWQKLIYAKTKQLAFPNNISKPLTAKAITQLQQIMGILLYYAWAANATMLVSLATLTLKNKPKELKIPQTPLSNS